MSITALGALGFGLILPTLKGFHRADDENRHASDRAVRVPALSVPDSVRGVATGVGSMPGTDPLAAARLVADLVPDLPHLVELPERGPGADMIGRTASLLVELPVDLQPAGWRLVDRPGADLRRAVAFLRQDLDVLEEVLDGYTGPLKIQITGPWTMAANLDKARGDKVIGDHGARRDLADSLIEGVRFHAAEVRRRVPGADVILQLDEPSLPMVLAGEISTVSGFGRLRAVAESEAEEVLRRLINGVGVPVLVHCCATNVPVPLISRAGAAGVAADLSVFPADDSERGSVAEAVEAGLVLGCGVVPTSPVSADESEPAGSVGSMRSQIADLWKRLDQPVDRLASSVIVTPACGLATRSPTYARAALRRVQAVARALASDPET